MKQKPFEILEHPSDVGITAYGKTLPELFENAAIGMFSLMSDFNSINPKKSFTIKVEAEDLEALLVNWLNELIFYEDSKKILFKKFKIESFSEKRLEAEVSGEGIDEARHKFSRPVKATTYSQLSIEKIDGIYKARIIFDV